MSSRRRFTPPAPPTGWHRWNSSGTDGRNLIRMISSGEVAQMSSAQIQESYPQYRVYEPQNFSKNVSRLRKELLIGNDNAYEDAMNGIQQLNVNRAPVNGRPVVRPDSRGYAQNGPSQTRAQQIAQTMRAQSPFQTVNGQQQHTSSSPAPPVVMSNILPSSHPRQGGYPSSAFAPSAEAVGLQTPRGMSNNNNFMSPQGSLQSNGTSSYYEVGISGLDGGLVQQMKLPYLMDEWFDCDVSFRRCSIQIWNLSGARHERFVAPDGNTLITRVVLGPNMTNPSTAFQRFKDTDGTSHFPPGHVRYVARQITVQSQLDENGNLVWEDATPLPFTCETRFQNYKGRPGMKNIQYGTGGQMHCFLELIEKGGGTRQSAYSSRRGHSNMVPDSISVISGMGSNNDTGSVAVSMASTVAPSMRTSTSSRFGFHQQHKGNSSSARPTQVRQEAIIEEMSIDESSGGGTSFYSPDGSRSGQTAFDVRQRAYNILRDAAKEPPVPIPLSPVKQYVKKPGSPKRQKVDGGISVKKNNKEKRDNRAAARKRSVDDKDSDCNADDSVLEDDLKQLLSPQSSKITVDTVQENNGRLKNDSSYEDEDNE